MPIINVMFTSFFLKKKLEIFFLIDGMLTQYMC